MKLRHDMLVHGVYIITTKQDERLGGLAVAWGTQVATDSFLIAVGGHSATRELILASKTFGVNILRSDQVAVGNWFGRQSIRDADKFQGVPYFSAKNGVPILEDCGAAYSCDVIEVFERGTHRLIVGKVAAIEKEPADFPPLIYRQEDYPNEKPKHPYQ